MEEPEAAGPDTAKQEFGKCGEGTELVDGTCELADGAPGGGSCLIATAAYGSEMAPQVQFLREIRDGKVMGTASGAAFMSGFNQAYYSFSPHVADYQRENPAFNEAVRVAITPLVASLGLMAMADTEQEILGYGIAVILANVGMYFVAPTMAAYGVVLARNKTRAGCGSSS